MIRVAADYADLPKKQGIICIGVAKTPIWQGDLQLP